jgi:hypothetical protein
MYRMDRLHLSGWITSKGMDRDYLQQVSCLASLVCAIDKHCISVVRIFGAGLESSDVECV